MNTWNRWRGCCNSWQWFDWGWRWPYFRHQFTTRTIWRPGFVPYRNTAWPPSIAGHTIARFQYDLLNWSRDRGVDPSQVAIDMQSGSTRLPRNF